MRARSALVAAVVAVTSLGGLFAAWSSGNEAPASGEPIAERATTTEAAPSTVAPGARRAQETTTSSQPPAAAPAQLRGGWVQLFDDTLKSRAGIRAMVEQAADANLNALFVQVVRRHDAYYRSSVLPRSPDPALPADHDVLAVAIEEGRRRGIQIHAWIVVAPAYHSVYDGLALPPGHVWVDHGPASADPWMAVDQAGNTGQYLDPALPGVQDHVAAIVKEIATRYDVDGIHTDYLRYDGVQYGYHPLNVSRFQAATGATGVPIPDDPQWTAWRRDRLTELAMRVRDVAKAARPDVVVSAAVIAQGKGPAAAGGFEGTVAYRDKLQDWRRWVETGVVDLAIPMVYFREANPEQAGWFRDWVAFVDGLRGNGAGTSVAVGLGAWLNSVGHSAGQAAHALAHSDGVAIFSLQQDSSDAPPGALVRALGPAGGGPFSEPAPPPGG